MHVQEHADFMKTTNRQFVLVIGTKHVYVCCQWENLFSQQYHYVSTQKETSVGKWGKREPQAREATPSYRPGTLAVEDHKPLSGTVK